MRTLLLLMLAIVSLPVCAAELQFNLGGQAFPVVNGVVDGDATPAAFGARFDIDTLSGLNSFGFSNGCLTAWNFSNVRTTNLAATVSGHTVLSQPSTTASGFGGDPFPGCSLEDGGINAGNLTWEEILVSITKPPNAQDPLADILPKICQVDGRGANGGAPVGCNFAFVPDWAVEVTSANITSVPEPGTPGLMLLGFGSVGLLLSRRRLASPAVTRKRWRGNRVAAATSSCRDAGAATPREV